jgi:DNA modification methylase
MILEVNINEIKPNPQNPRVIKDDKFKKLVQSIKEFPEMLNIRPIVVNKDMIVLGGNMRLKACREAGLKEIPIIYAENLDEDKQREFIIKDNVGFGEWDWNNLKEWDQDELIEWGLDIPEFKEEHLEATDDGYELPDEIQTDIVLGDLFEIGEHRLLCGDSTDSDQVAKLMNGEKADMVFTDPPYNLQERGQTKRTNKTENKRENFGDWDIKFNPLDVIPNIYLFTSENSNIFICTSNYLFGKIHDEFEKLELRPNYIVWCKNNPMPSLSKNRFVQATELIIHGIKGKPMFIYPKGENLPNYFNGNVEPHKFGHPAQKPIYVVEQFINKQNGSILDLFLGSGSTMVASHQLKRKCYGMELDPKYCQVIIDRMRKLDPSIEIKKNGILLETVGKQS